VEMRFSRFRAKSFRLFAHPAHGPTGRLGPNRAARLRLFAHCHISLIPTAANAITTINSRVGCNHGQPSRGLTAGACQLRETIHFTVLPIRRQSTKRKSGAKKKKWRLGQVYNGRKLKNKTFLYMAV